jgi:hypothetical protein
MFGSFQDPPEAWKSRLVSDRFEKQRDGVFVGCERIILFVSIRPGFSNTENR